MSAICLVGLAAGLKSLLLGLLMLEMKRLSPCSVGVVKAWTWVFGLEGLVDSKLRSVMLNPRARGRSSSSASSMSFGASGSYGFFTAGVDHESSEAHSQATQELAEAAVKISFECMRVDITRPWLRPELFYDDDLVCGPQVK